VFDAKGDLVANAPHVPVHLGSMSDAVWQVIERTFGKVRPGDAYMLNSPFCGGTHLPDITVITPVFVGNRPLFWLGSRGHHADVGGKTPGSSPPDSRVIEEEGLVIDLFPLVVEGVFQDAALRELLASGRWPARAPEQNIADLQAQIAANECGRQGLLRMVAEQGEDVVLAYMQHVQDNAEESVRQVIAELTDGSFTYPMDTGQVIHVDLRIDRENRAALVDFTGSSAQHEGNYNAPYAIAQAVVMYVFRCLGGTGAGPGFAGCGAVQSHMTNTRMTDPEVLEARFPVRLEAFGFRRGSGGLGRWAGGDGAVRRLRFLEAVTVTVLSSSRQIAPFGGAGGEAGKLGQNRVIWPDGRVQELAGNAQVELPAGAEFVMETPGGGGWGAI
jgi:N-methylhydantoinase B/oxoprolinase/acetone carboxylase alpha subunit